MDSAVVNLYKAQKSPAVRHVGVSAFYTVVSFVSEETLRHPPTRQYLSSCVEILGQVRARSFCRHVQRMEPALRSCLCRAQVFIQGNAEECGRVLKTILEERRLCPLISPFFTPNAAPDQLVFLYQDVVTSLHLDTADVIFMLLTKVCRNILRCCRCVLELGVHPEFSTNSVLDSLVRSLTCPSG